MVVSAEESGPKQLPASFNAKPQAPALLVDVWCLHLSRRLRLGVKRSGTHGSPEETGSCFGPVPEARVRRFDNRSPQTMAAGITMRTAILNQSG